jgi:glycerol-3-phosphate dehydrogenase (NAD(P)+)
MATVSVIGAGAWGTAIATAVTRAGNDVMLWARESDVVDAINTSHENTTFLKGVELPQNIIATDNLAEAIAKDIVFMVTPAQFLESTCKQIKELGLNNDTILVLCSKGITQNSLKMMNEVVEEVLDNPVAVLSGPTFAIEIANGLPGSASLSSESNTTIEAVRHVIESDSFKIFPNNDVIGTEIGGSVKNVIAIACGIAEGSGLGESAKAALMVRGVREMVHMCEKLGGNPDTITHLCGVGDLILTANSQKSRNFSLGYALGKGEALEDIMNKRNTVAEGVASSESVVNLAKKIGASVPICAAVANIVHGKKDIDQTIRKLIRES